MMFLKVLATVTLIISSTFGQIVVEKETSANLQDNKDLYRLPKTIIPVSYTLNLRPDLETFEFEGDVNIIIKPVEATYNIMLHVFNLTFDDIWVSKSKNENLSISLPIINESFQVLRFKTDEELKKDEEYGIWFTFQGYLRDDMNGFYKSSYMNSANETRWLAATQFQPTHARSVFPCFDEPEFKSVFNISISTPEGYHTLGNMPTISTEEQDGWTTYTFQQTELMSTYLIAFVISDFETLTDEENQYKFSAWARPEAIDKANFSQEVGPKLVDFYESYTGIDYILPKIDQVALPDFSAGAMENWGLITYRETGLLFYNDSSTEANKKGVALVVAHELAHMWFGNLVTLDWWDYAWLNEGFARYFQYVSTNKVIPEWNLMDQFLIDQHHTAFALDALVSAQSLSSECITPEEITAKFGTITYNKGASILRMLSHILTEEVFQNGLQEYLTQNQMKNTIPVNLFDALELKRKEANIGVYTVHQVIENWTTQPGYPVVTVTKEGKYFTISQEQFLLKDTEESNTGYQWWVPLTWTIKSNSSDGFSNTQPIKWLLPDSTPLIMILELESTDWIIFNNQETGYYRVNYDDENWNLISKELEENHNNIHVLNRAQLLDDALNLARASVLKYEIALQLTQFLKDEVDYIPWASAFNAFSFLDRRLIGVDGYDNFKAYVGGLISNTYNNIGFDEQETDSQTTLLHRVNILTWACHLQHGDCVDRAQEMFHAYYENPEENSIPANLRSIVYCTALKYGGEEEWNFLWEKYQQSIVATEKVTIISALGCVNNDTILNQYLDLSITEDSGIKKQDAASVFSAVYSNPEGVNTAFQFLRTHYDKIAIFYAGMNAVGKSITGIAGRLTTQKQVDDLHKFINDRENELGAAAVAGRNAVEEAQADMDWTNLNKDNITNWLKDHKPPETGGGGGGGGGNGDGSSSLTNFITLTFSAVILVFFMEKL